MSKILIIYSSVHGQTRKISDFIAKQLMSENHQVSLVTLGEQVELADYDKIVIGASIRHGKHKPAVYDFITSNIEILTSRATSFFSVSLVARKPGKDTPETNPYMQAFLSKTPWQPDLLQVFGGNLDYQGYNSLDRNIIRFIMWMTKGPTDAETKVEYTDWKKVEQFAEQLHQL